MNRKTYRAFHASKLAAREKKKRGRKRKLESNLALRILVFDWLKLDWSPEQIARRLRVEYPLNTDMQITPETIYSYLYVHPKQHLRRELILHLRRTRKIRQKRRVKNPNIEEKRGKIPCMVSIEDRPKEVETRLIPGHWEGDLVVGRCMTSALGTLTERTTRLTLLVPLKKKDPESVRKAFARALSRLPEKLKLTLTYDQGKEMLQHQLFTKSTNIQVYFAHKSCPWERGTNENTNGLVRQYFPKGTDFNIVSVRRIKKAQDLLNGRPRKCLNFLKPIEVFTRLLQ
jgi:IS30 family transposase